MCCFKIVADMPQGQIQSRPWLIKFGHCLVLSAKPAVDRSEYASGQLASVLPFDSENLNVYERPSNMPVSNQDGRRIRGLQHVSFAYKSVDPADTLKGMRNLSKIRFIIRSSLVLDLSLVLQVGTWSWSFPWNCTKETVKTAPTKGQDYGRILAKIRQEWWWSQGAHSLALTLKSCIGIKLIRVGPGTNRGGVGHIGRAKGSEGLNSREIWFTCLDF